MKPSIAMTGLATVGVIALVAAGATSLAARHPSAASRISVQPSSVSTATANPPPVSTVTPGTLENAPTVFATPHLPLGALSQQQIEAKILEDVSIRIERAHLEGPAIGVKSRLMTMAEFDARFDPGANDGPLLDKPYWLVLIKGNVVVIGAPRQDGGDPRLHADHLGVLVDPQGKVVASGVRGTAADVERFLDAPVPAWTPLPARSVPK